MLKEIYERETTPFFIPYCQFLRHPLCVQDESLYMCDGLILNLNREFKNKNLKQIFEIDKVVIAGPLHRKRFLKTSIVSTNLLFPSIHHVPPHLREYVRTNKNETFCVINIHHPKVTIGDLKLGYFMIRIDESHLHPQKLYCAVLHELRHIRDHLYPEEVDRYGKLFEKFRMGHEQYPLWKKRMVIILVTLSFIGSTIFDLVIESNALSFRLKIILFLILSLCYLYFPIYKIVYFLHDLETDKKVVEIAEDYNFNTEFYEERKNSLRKYILIKILETFLVLLFLGTIIFMIRVDLRNIIQTYQTHRI